ncbi:hypothetical protein IPJ72_03415 [Candidatus Peregrinibacteria bacterium]|nr:MAG: hypothetical protein IPJ72_03415 [Candidatus Peregrinibacteria bacterium]
MVACYNIVSAETGLAIGAHNLDKIKGNVVIRKTNGHESFTPLGGKSTAVQADKYAAVDESGKIICWMEVKQSDKTKVMPGENRDILIYVQGNPVSTDEELESALNQVCQNILRFCASNATIRLV